MPEELKNLFDVTKWSEDRIQNIAKAALLTSVSLFLLQNGGKYAIGVCLLIVAAYLSFRIPTAGEEIRGHLHGTVMSNTDSNGIINPAFVLKQQEEDIEPPLVETFLTQGGGDTLGYNIGAPSSEGRSFGDVGSNGLNIVLPGGKAPFNNRVLTQDVKQSLVSLDFGTSAELMQGKNNALSGPPNPKTLIPPPMAMPLGDLEFWRASETTTHSHINSRNLQDVDEYLGGEGSRVNYHTSRKPCEDTELECTSMIKDLDSKPLSREEMNRLPFEEHFMSELQPGIYADSLNQPVYFNAGLLNDFPLPETSVFTEQVPGTTESIKIYKESVETQAPAKVHRGPYTTLDRAYKYPEIMVRERLPKRYGDWNKRNVHSGDTIVTEMVRDLSGAEEMSLYMNSRNKLDVYDVTVGVPLFEINRSAVQNQIEVTNQFRSDMQSSLMRKRNAEEYLRKQYPIDVNHRRMLGGMQ